MIKILHFSDLHIHKNYDQDKVLERFITDIKDQDFDLIVCSGDIVAKGNYQNKDSVLKFFDKIKQVCGLEIPIIICPGNHDINLKNRDEVYTSVFNITESEQANKLFDSLYENKKPDLLAHFSEYSDLVESITGKKSHNKFFSSEIFSIKNKKVGVASLNSAWLTKGGGEQDYGKLFISPRQLERALDSLEECDLKIVVWHHPLEWLSPKEKNIIQNILTNQVNILFCGHMHTTNASQLSNNIGSLVTSNTGCIYQSRDYFNGYTYLEVNDNSIKTIAREYYDARSTFGPSLRFSEDSTITFALKKKECSLIDVEVINHISNTINNKLLTVNSGVAPQGLTGIFVEPPLAYKDEKTFFASKTDEKTPKENKIKLTDLYGLNNNILFLGKRESGKSTLINYLVSHQFNMLHPSAIFGVVIDLDKKVDGKDISMDRMISLALTFLGSNLNKKEIESHLLKGEILVAFDNINLSKKNELKTVESFIKKYNRCRYIATTSEPDIVVKDIEFEENIFHDQVYIHSFGKNQTEELVKKWFHEDIDAGIKNLKLVKKLINQLNVPCTPFLISMLLWVVEKQKNPSYLFNEASVIQVLIEGLLNKFGEEKRREDIDSTILSHFLKEFAFYLDEKGINIISNSDFDVFKINYFKKRGLTSKETLRSDLIANGILYDDNESICFKFDCFRAYFLAEKFNTDQDFWLKIIQEKNISKYSVEFEYFSGIYRDKELLLEKIGIYIKDLFDELNLNVDKLAVEKDTSLLLSQKIFGEIHTRLDDEPVSEPEIPNAASIDHSASRTNIQNPREESEHHNALVVLKTFAAVLRNSELVANIDLKMNSLDSLFDYWNEIFLFLISMVKKDISSLIQSYLKDEQVSQEEHEEFLKIFNLVITCVYAHIIVEKSSSPKMKQLFEEVFKSNKPGHKTLTILCFIDIDLNKSIEMTRRALSSLVGNVFYLQAIYFYYLHKYIENGRFSRSRDISTKIKVILGELTFALSGKDSYLKTKVINETVDKFTNDSKTINILEIKSPEKI